MICRRLRQVLIIIPLCPLASSVAAAHHVCGFHLSSHESFAQSKMIRRRCMISHRSSNSAITRLDMIRNIDLPEALVFYGIESMMEPIHDTDSSYCNDANDFVPCSLRPGIIRLINECEEVGTAALLLCEEVDENCLTKTFQKAHKWASCSGDKGLQLRTSSNPAVHFRCLNSVFKTEVDDEYDYNLEFYNLKAYGRSPSPAFLLDSLRSVSIDPRGFGGSSGFGRGQWIEPRRCPMPARAVVFIAGDWSYPKKGLIIGEEEHKSNVKDRCTAARVAGCRVIYVEKLQNQTRQEKNNYIKDDMPTMALCDAVISTFGNDDPRDPQPITLDAISTPGDYWLNPPTPRDDKGNSVSVDEKVESFRSNRAASTSVSKDVSDNAAEIDEDNGISEDDINAILADLDR